MQRTEEQWEDRKHRLIVHAIKEASEELMDRYRSTPEANYWKTTNVVRRNLLMASVRMSISNDWNPVDSQSVLYLKTLALARLSSAIIDHIRSNRSPPPSPPLFD